jgi:methionyl-tRNA formyltransferase
MRIVFFGSPAAALPCLEALLAAGHSIGLVVTQPDKPAGRGRLLTPCPVKAYAAAHGLPTYEPARIRRDPEALDRLRAAWPDIHVVVAYGQILPGPLIDFPVHRSLNVHFSLLPRYRGASPVAWSIRNGEKSTGISIFRLNEEMDEGDILATAEMEIGVTETTGILETRLADLGADLLVRTLKAIDSITPIPQDHGAATYAPKLKKDDGLIGWEGNGAEVDRHIRAMTPWPTAFTFLRTERLIILEGRLQEKSGEPGGQRQGFIPGTVLEAGKTGIRILCGQGPDYRITRLQPEGRKSMDAAAYIAGGKITAGDILGRPPA